MLPAKSFGSTNLNHYFTLDKSSKLIDNVFNESLSSTIVYSSDATQLLKRECTGSFQSTSFSHFSDKRTSITSKFKIIQAIFVNYRDENYAVLLDNHNSQSNILITSCDRSTRIKRLIALPYLVSYIHPFESDSILTPGRNFIDISGNNVFLPCIGALFRGAIFIGFENGIVSMLDWLNFDYKDFISEEIDKITPSETAKFLINLNQDNEHVWRFNQSVENKHVILPFNESHLDEEYFNYKAPNGKIFVRVSHDAASISHLEYFQHMRSLLVGFEFGGWQIWSLQLKSKPQSSELIDSDFGCPVLVYTGKHFPRGCPITTSALMEPSDDPRFFCYLWLAWGVQINLLKDHYLQYSDSIQKENEESEIKKMFASVCLHQLAFNFRCEEVKPISKALVYHYQGLVGICDRLVTHLQVTPLSSNMIYPPSHFELNHQLLIQRKYSSQTQFVHEESITRLDYKLVRIKSFCDHQLAAIIWPQDNIFKIGLFDLNQWYHAQMPFCIKPDNGFFVLFETFEPKPSSYYGYPQIAPDSIKSYWSKPLASDYAITSIVAPTYILESYYKNIISKLSTPRRVSKQTDIVSNVPPLALGRMKSSLFLRPSALSFCSFQLHRSESKGTHLCGLIFKSRQERLLLRLKEALTAAKIGEITPSPFRINSFLVEFCDCGLLPEETEFEAYEEFIFGKLNSQDLDLRSMLCGRDAIGSNVAKDFFDLQVSNCLEDFQCMANLLMIYLRPLRVDSEAVQKSKKRRVDEDDFVETQNNNKNKSIESIPWIILSCLLLDYNDLEMLKNVPFLAQMVLKDDRQLDQSQDFSKGLFLTDTESRKGAELICQPRFQSRWIWLSFQRLRLRFDDLIQRSLFSYRSVEFVPYYEIAKIHTQIQTLQKLAEYNIAEHRKKRTSDIKTQFNQVSTLKRRLNYEESYATESALDLNPSELQNAEDAFLKCLNLYSRYTSVICLFMKVGILRHNSSDTIDDGYLVSSFNSQQFEDHLKPINRNDSFHEETRDRLQLTHLLMKVLFRKDDDSVNQSSLAESIWRQHENYDIDAPLMYPPKRIQSLCALWQLPSLSEPEDELRLFVLTIFILLDSLMILHLSKSSQYTKDDLSLMDESFLSCKTGKKPVKGLSVLAEENSFVSSNSTACEDLPGPETSRLSLGSNVSFLMPPPQCQSFTGSNIIHKKLRKRFLSKLHVLSRLLRSRFPQHLTSQLTLINSLWLLDRGHSKDSNTRSHLLKMTNSNSPLLFHEKSSTKQLELINCLLLADGQEQLPLSTEFVIQQRGFKNFESENAESLLIQNENRISSKSSVLLWLLEFRSLIRKGLIPELQKRYLTWLTDICLKKGLLLNLFNIGLDSNENQIIEEYLSSQEDPGPLFNVFVAQARFEEALALYSTAQERKEEYRTLMNSSAFLKTREPATNSLSIFSTDTQIIAKSISSKVKPTLKSSLPFCGSNISQSSNPLKTNLSNTTIVNNFEPFVKQVSNQRTYITPRRTVNSKSLLTNNDTLKTPKIASIDDVSSPKTPISASSARNMLKLIFTPPASSISGNSTESDTNNLAEEINFKTPVSILKNLNSTRKTSSIGFAVNSNLQNELFNSPIQSLMNSEPLKEACVITRTEEISMDSSPRVTEISTPERIEETYINLNAKEESDSCSFSKTEDKLEKNFIHQLIDSAQIKNTYVQLQDSSSTQNSFTNEKTPIFEFSNPIFQTPHSSNRISIIKSPHSFDFSRPSLPFFMPKGNDKENEISVKPATITEDLTSFVAANEACTPSHSNESPEKMILVAQDSSSQSPFKFARPSLSMYRLDETLVYEDQTILTNELCQTDLARQSNLSDKSFDETGQNMIENKQCSFVSESEPIANPQLDDSQSYASSIKEDDQLSLNESQESNEIESPILTSQPHLLKPINSFAANESSETSLKYPVLTSQSLVRQVEKTTSSIVTSDSESGVSTRGRKKRASMPLANDTIEVRTRNRRTRNTSISSQDSVCTNEETLTEEETVEESKTKRKTAQRKKGTTLKSIEEIPNPKEHEASVATITRRSTRRQVHEIEDTPTKTTRKLGHKTAGSSKDQKGVSKIVTRKVSTRR